MAVLSLSIPDDKEGTKDWGNQMQQPGLFQGRADSVLTAFFRCSLFSFFVATSASFAMAQTPLTLGEVRYFAYQIQDIDQPGAVDALAATHYDMLIIEPTRTDWSSDARNFDTPGAVARLKAGLASDGIHRKLVIAYIDIGEAEDWRWYWKWSTDWPAGSARPADWPDYIVTHDPDGWGGNYPVAFWDERWKDVVIYGRNQSTAHPGGYNSIIDEVIKAGFDGIYLDWVEAFENSEIMAEATRQGKNPADEMVTFIQEMRAYAELRSPTFIIIQQNAASLVGLRPDLTSVIDGIAQEAIWYDGDATDDWNDVNGYDFVNDTDLVAYYLGFLNQYRAAGLPVFDVEYALGMANSGYTLATANGFVPYCTRRSLSNVTTTPPPGY